MARVAIKREKKRVDPRNIYAERIAALLRIPGQKTFTEVYRLKTKSSFDDLFYVSPRAFRNPQALRAVHGDPFPPSISKMFSRPALGRPGSVLSEVVWGICRCLQFAPQLREFVVLRNRFERAILTDDRTLASSILADVEAQFGWSMWLLQNRLATTQIWNSLDEKRRLAREYEEQAKENTLAKFLISFISKRSEATGLKNHLKDELEKAIGQTDNPTLGDYLRTKLFDLAYPKTKSIPATLFFEAQSSLLDHYETLVLILQSIAIDANLPDDVRENFITALSPLASRVADPRNAMVLRSLGADIPLGFSDIDKRRAAIVEAYTCGRYQEVVDHGYAYLEQEPDDIALCVIRAKAAVAGGINPQHMPGLLGDVERRFVQIFNLTDDAYAAAYEIYSLFERFYGHAWANYVRIAMVDILGEEEAQFPASSLTDILVRDKFVTPFTALIIHGDSSEKTRKNPDLVNLYPVTSSVLDTVLKGRDPNPAIDNIRATRYLARHDLSFGSGEIAAKHYAWLMKNASKNDAFRAAAGAALAYLRLRDVSKATEAIVDGYFLNSHVAIILPVGSVIAQLESPSDWPEGIAVPLIFEIYTTFTADEKQTHLRYAFEQFQLKNRLTEPEDLVARCDEFGEDRVIMYLDRVWRPENMRQTLLYEGTKDIEEARIKVCRVLASLDSQNSARYLDEIRERVKQQEISKVTKLVEQTKVYVDVAAIRKSLKAKLGDSYSRYKTAAQTGPKVVDPVVEKITDLVSQTLEGQGQSLTNVLSTLHILPGDDHSESELDVQFAALFSEVTNEFLRGDHGLNAYLSTRVRHGKLSNTMRKAVADEHLVTPLEEGKADKYVPNEYWKKHLQALPQVQLVQVLDALENFTRKFDSIVDFIRDRLLQIRIIHEYKDNREHPDALFIYRSSNLERRFVQEVDRKITNLEEFVDQCVETLWDKTDDNLKRVQSVFSNDIRERFLSCFDELSTNLPVVPGSTEMSDLVNAIARARTNTQTKLGVVRSWFKRSEVYDRQDYPVDFPVHIALNMVQNIMPTANQKLNVEIISGTEQTLVPGRTLDAMVDMFADLFENALERSGLPVDQLKIIVDVRFAANSYSASVKNNVAPHKPTVEDEERVSRVRDSQHKIDSRRKAQSEGGSGLHKIWRAINSPIYKEPQLEFAYDYEGFFNVNIRYKLDRTEDELSTR